MREPAVAAYRYEMTANHDGIIDRIDNRRLALIAKLAGAPQAPTAGIYLRVKQGQRIEKDQPLYTVHADAPGELEYAKDYIASQQDIISIHAD
jgi:thymidine phosphorylase